MGRLGLAMSFFEFPQWRTPRAQGGRARRRVAETITILTCDIERLEPRELLATFVVPGNVDVPTERGPALQTSANIVVMLDEAAPSNAMLAFATQDGTATSDFSVNNGGFNRDFGAKSGTLTIAAGQTSGTITVDVFGDNHVEGAETFFINLSNPTGAMLLGGASSTTVTVTILDDEDPNAPAVSVNNATVNEGNRGTTNITIPVILNPVAQNNVTAFFFVADGSAKDSMDFVSTEGQLTIPPGQSTATITVPIINDTTPEPNETFSIVIDSVNGANVKAPVANVTIFDNDGGGGNATRATISAQNTEGTEGNTVTLTVDVNADGLQDVPFKYKTKNGSAKAGQDYQSVSGTVTIPAGMSQGTLTVPVFGDTTPEADETFFIKLQKTKGSKLVIENKKVTVTIRDDDTNTSILSVQASSAGQRAALIVYDAYAPVTERPTVALSHDVDDLLDEEWMKHSVALLGGERHNSVAKN
jgi:hypothetical protein